MKTIRVGRKLAGIRLVDFLSDSIGCSKKRAKALLDSRRVFVNRRRTWMAKHLLREGDSVEFPQGDSDRPDDDIGILYSTAGLLIAGKPAGFLSQGQGSIEQRLRRKLSDPELAAVHRLDRDTSGAMIFAQNPEVRDSMIELFRRRDITKEYYAIVYGSYGGAGRHRRSIDGKTAITDVKTIQTGARASLLLCRIETGRTHQIRRHLAATGHPVAGDKQYGGQLLDQPLFRGIGRQMLHAHRLAFNHPVTGESVDCCAPPPNDFIETARKLSIANF